MNSGKLTLRNSVPAMLATVTFKVTDCTGAVCRFTVPADGSVIHPVQVEQGPWSLVAIIDSHILSALGSTTAPIHINDPNAIINCGLDQIMAALSVQMTAPVTPPSCVAGPNTETENSDL